jgi:hypothetical protein
VLAETADAVVAVTDLRVYPDGFVVDLTAVIRRPDGRRLHNATDMWGGDDPVPDELLRFGVEFADGGIACNLDMDRRKLIAPPALR